MYFEEAWSITAMPVFVIGYLIGLAAFRWGCGWPWWWALPVPVIPALIGAVVVCGLIASFFEGLAWWRWQAERNDWRSSATRPEPEPQQPPPDEAAAGNYVRLKRALAKHLHPNALAAASPIERAVREAIFKEVWAEVEKIEGE